MLTRDQFQALGQLPDKQCSHPESDRTIPNARSQCWLNDLHNMFNTRCSHQQQLSFTLHLITAVQDQITQLFANGCATRFSCTGEIYTGLIEYRFNKGTIGGLTTPSSPSSVMNLPRDNPEDITAVSTGICAQQRYAAPECQRTDDCHRHAQQNTRQSSIQDVAQRE